MTGTRSVTTPFNAHGAAKVVNGIDLGGRRREEGPR
jgi:hypothetical protein